MLWGTLLLVPKETDLALGDGHFSKARLECRGGTTSHTQRVTKVVDGGCKGRWHSNRIQKRGAAEITTLEIK